MKKIFCLTLVLSLSGCASVAYDSVKLVGKAAVGTTKLVGKTAIGTAKLAGNAVATTARVATAPFRSNDDNDDDSDVG